MTEAHKLPLSGYSIIKVFNTSAELKLEKPVATEPGKEGITIAWDWRLHDETLFEVRLSAEVAPTKRRPYSANTDVIGLFRKVAEVPKVSLTEFVTLQAVAILLPYLRQFLTSLTINALAGPYYLPTLNVADLMKDFDPAKATGAKQLADEGKVDSQVIAPTDVKTKRHRKRA